MQCTKYIQQISKYRYIINKNIHCEINSICYISFPVSPTWSNISAYWLRPLRFDIDIGILYGFHDVIFYRDYLNLPNKINHTDPQVSLYINYYYQPEKLTLFS